MFSSENEGDATLARCWRSLSATVKKRSGFSQKPTNLSLQEHPSREKQNIDRKKKVLVHDFLEVVDKHYSTVGCRRTGGRRSQPGSFSFFTTSANLVLIFQSVFESSRLACCAQTVCDDACWSGNAAETFQTVDVESFRSQQCPRRSRLHSKRCLRVVKLFLTHFSSLGSFLFLGEIPAWPFFGKPFFGTRQYCT